MRICKTYEFSAGHFLPNVPEGHPCKRQHGHNYKIEVMLDGDMEPLMGWVEDFGLLDLYTEELIQRLDHQNLNDIIENPTAENLVLWFLEHFKLTFLADRHLVAVRVWETPKCYAEGSL